MSNLFLFGVCSVMRSYWIQKPGCVQASPLHPHSWGGLTTVKEPCLASLSAPPYIERFQFGNEICCTNSASGKKEKEKTLSIPEVLLGCPPCTSLTVLFSGLFHPPFLCGSRRATQGTPPGSPVEVQGAGREQKQKHHGRVKWVCRPPPFYSRARIKSQGLPLGPSVLSSPGGPRTLGGSPEAWTDGRSALSRGNQLPRGLGQMWAERGLDRTHSLTGPDFSARIQLGGLRHQSSCSLLPPGWRAISITPPRVS